MRTGFIVLFLSFTVAGCLKDFGDYIGQFKGLTCESKGFNGPGVQWWECNLASHLATWPVASESTPSCGVLFCAMSEGLALDQAQSLLGRSDSRLVCLAEGDNAATLKPAFVGVAECLDMTPMESDCAELHEPCVASDGSFIPCCDGLVCDASGIMPPGQSSQCCISYGEMGARPCKSSSDCCQETGMLGCVDGVCQCVETGQACSAPFDLGNTPCCNGPCENGFCCAWETDPCDVDADCCNGLHCSLNGCEFDDSP